MKILTVELLQENMQKKKENSDALVAFEKEVNKYSSENPSAKKTWMQTSASSQLGSFTRITVVFE